MVGRFTARPAGAGASLGRSPWRPSTSLRAWLAWWASLVARASAAFAAYAGSASSAPARQACGYRLCSPSRSVFLSPSGRLRTAPASSLPAGRQAPASGGLPACRQAGLLRNFFCCLGQSVSAGGGEREKPASGRRLRQGMFRFQRNPAHPALSMLGAKPLRVFAFLRSELASPGAGTGSCSKSSATPQLQFFREKIIAGQSATPKDFPPHTAKRLLPSALRACGCALLC